MVTQQHKRCFTLVFCVAVGPYYHFGRAPFDLKGSFPTHVLIVQKFFHSSCTPEVFVSQSDSAVDTGDGSDCVDEGEALRLREWVAARGLPSAVTNALLSHCYVLTDLLQHAQREDIAKLNLKYVYFQ